MKKLCSLFVAVFTAISLCACTLPIGGGSANIKRAEKELQSGNYQTALSLYSVAKDEGAKGLDNVISILEAYVNAKAAYDRGDMPEAERLLNEAGSANGYSIKDDFDALREKITAAAALDGQIEGVRKMLADGDTVSAKANLTELYAEVYSLDGYKKDVVDALNSEVENAIAAASKTPEPTQSPAKPAAPVQPPRNTAYEGDTIVKYTMYVSNVKNSIYLRSRPYENSSNIICTIPLGTAVGFIESRSDGFSKISYNGQLGFSKSMYLSSSKQTQSSGGSGSQLVVSNVKYAIYLRSAPVEDPGNIICEIPVGSVVGFVSGGTGTFYKISWNGYVGYAKSEYLRWN